MKIRILLLVLLCLPFIGITQTVMNSTLGSVDDMASRGDIRMHEAFKHLVNRLDKGAYMSLENIEGSPYYNETFVLGKLLVNGKEVPGNYGIRYNAYNDQIELQGANETEALIKAVNYSCVINNNKYIYRSYQAKKKDTPTMGYFQVLTDEANGLLLKQERMKFKEALEAKTSMTQPLPARFIPYTNYYYLKNGTSIAAIIHKKTILDNFEPEVQSAIKKYIKSEKIDLKKEYDLLKLFSYYASL